MTDETQAADAAPDPAPKAPAAAPSLARAAKAVALTAPSADRAIAAWVATLHDSPLSRATPAWNFLQTKLPDLRALIEQEFNRQ